MFYLKRWDLHQSRNHRARTNNITLLQVVPFSCCSLHTKLFYQTKVFRYCLIILARVLNNSHSLSSHSYSLWLRLNGTLDWELVFTCCRLRDAQWREGVWGSGVVAGSRSVEVEQMCQLIGDRRTDERLGERKGTRILVHLYPLLFIMFLLIVSRWLLIVTELIVN